MTNFNHFTTFLQKNGSVRPSIKSQDIPGQNDDFHPNSRTFQDFPEQEKIPGHSTTFQDGGNM